MASQDTGRRSPGPCSADNNQQRRKYDSPGWSLRAASREGKLDIVVEILKNYRVDLNCEDVYGYTPLKGAAQYGRVGVVERLLEEKGIKIDKRDSLGDTPLIVASRGGFDKVVELLLQKGADPKVKCRAGRTALDWARERETYSEVVRLLEEAIESREKSSTLNRIRRRIAGSLRS
ncbi:MAG: hypothetical protein M1840_001756 [Geoglossum simile]|nr:MAG: hypothetical protein M1840_001756 [Geoglossum simile]